MYNHYNEKLLSNFILNNFIFYRNYELIIEHKYIKYINMLIVNRKDKSGKLIFKNENNKYLKINIYYYSKNSKAGFRHAKEKKHIIKINFSEIFNQSTNWKKKI